MKTSISVIIPAYNEENRILQTLRKISDYLEKQSYDYELIVVDDGSKDSTRKIVDMLSNEDSRITITPPRENKGKGFSVKQGVLMAQKDLILFSDADLSTPIEELQKMVPLLQDYDIVIGSRRLKDSNIAVKQPFYRRWPGNIFPFIVRAFLVQNIKDTQCGFKLFKKDVAHILFNKQRISGFSFDAEVLFIAKKWGIKVKEVPITWRNSLDSKIKIFRDPFLMLLDVFRIRLNDMHGKYSRTLL